MLQRLMENVEWQAVEVYLQEYLIRNFVQSSVKRNTEFDTLWYLAHAEGGKDHLQSFFKELEAEAQKV